MGQRLFTLTCLFTACLVSVLCLAHLATADDHAKRTKDDGHFNKDGEHNPEYDHEAVLGSRQEASEFDQLSPEESKERLGALAKQMDLDQDGSVDKEELTSWIVNSMRKLDEEDVRERFVDMDVDKDGLLSWQEYKKDAFGDSHDGGPLATEDVSLMNEDHRYFDAADGDNDGKLSRDEFKSFQNPEGAEHMFPSLLSSTLAAKDENYDGKLSVDEFVGHYNPGDEEWVEQEKQRFHEQLDVDKDGQLDRTEMKRWLIPNLDESAREEAVHLIGQADKDADKKLTYAEIVEEHEVFVGSEATNYGQHLEDSMHEEL